MRRTISLTLPALLFPLLMQATTPPLVCSGGTPLGWIDMKVTRGSGAAPLDLQRVNQLLAGDTISYRPVKIASLEPKKARIGLLLVPADGSKILVSEPRPADRPTSWMVPFRTQLASLVWGPEGLNRAKVASLVTKNNDLIAQLADYAQKTEDTQALIQAITAQQSLDTSQNLDAAVAGFARQFPSTKLDRTQPAQVQLNTLLGGVNSSLSAYDPLAQNPEQRATQSAGLIAAVSGMFFGGGAGLAASGGVALVNLHSMLFPRTEFLSALAVQQPAANAAKEAFPSTGLCGNKLPAVARTEFAFLWAIRIPDSAAPQVALASPEHLPIGIKSPVSLNIQGGDWKLLSRVHDWKLIPADGTNAAPLPVNVNTSAQRAEVDLSGGNFKPGTWKMAGAWDWEPFAVSGDIVLHEFADFKTAHLAKESQDKLIAGAGPLDLDLTGDDFEFVHTIQFRKDGDLFDAPQTVPFHLMKATSTGPQTTLKIRMDTRQLATGNYSFLIAQTDDKVHEVPFRVLPNPPSITGTPILLNTGSAAQSVVLHGSGLDRIESLSANGATITLDRAASGDSRNASVTLAPEVKPGAVLPVQMKATDFEEPITVPDALMVAGQKPVITTVRQSSAGADSGIALNPGEMALNSLVSFELGVKNAPSVSAIKLTCKDPNGTPPLRIAMGETKPDAKLARESADTVFLLFDTQSAGPAGCRLMATLITAGSGESEPRELGSIMLLPKIDSFQLTDEPAGGSAYFATLQGRDLESIGRVGWDAQNGLPVEAIPAPLAGPENKERLRVTIPWPAPSPHAPLYIWLRGEDRGRLTTSRY